MKFNLHGTTSSLRDCRPIILCLSVCRCRCPVTWDHHLSSISLTQSALLISACGSQSHAWAKPRGAGKDTVQARGRVQTQWGLSEQKEDKGPAQGHDGQFGGLPLALSLP